MLLLVVGMTSACGGSSDDGATNGGNGSSGEPIDPSTLDDGASVVVAWMGPAQTLDPHLSRAPGELAYTTAIFDRLVQVSADGNELEPMLAESWEFVDDGSALELRLRPEVSFHDGTPFDAAAVAANIERMQTHPESTVADSVAVVSSVEEVDDLTVRLELDGGGAGLPAIFATNSGMMVSPAAIEEDRDLSLDPGDAGTGPFVAVEMNAGEKVVYERAETYWDDELIRPARLEISFIGDGTTRVNGAQSGQLDVAGASGFDASSVLPMIERGELQGQAFTIRTPFTLFFDPAVAPFDDPDVRRAINFAIDRTAIADGLYEGTCAATAQAYPDGHWGHNEAAESAYDFDPDAARTLLEGAGGVSFTIEVAAGSAHQPMAEAIQQQLEEVGMQVSVSPVPQAETYARFASRESSASVLSIIPGVDPSTLLSTTFTGGLNLLEGGGEEAERIATLAAEGDDPARSQDERAEIYDEIQQIISDEALYAPVCNPTHIWLHGEDVAGVDAGMRGAWTGIPIFTGIGKTR